MGLQLTDDLKNSIYDGMFANAFATLTGGVFLTGFALYLGLNDFMIGLVAAMPFMVTVFQLPAAYLAQKTGNRKQIAYWAAAFARGLWLPILIVTFLPIASGSMKLLFILAFIFLSHSFISVSYVSWFSWLAELVPEEIRGRFFGTRNMLCGAAGMIAMVAFGKLLDYLDGHTYGGLPIGFGIIFISAVLFGMISLHFLNRISEPEHGSEMESPISIGILIYLPFKERNFRNFLTFTFLWSFSVYVASPFFTLYFLRDLRFTYGFVALLGMLSAIADMVGMRVWGRISDKVKNKAVIRVSSWIAIILPLAWISARPESVVIPITLHIVGGGFWAGINLCMNNLLLKISPQEQRASYISAFNITGGLGSALGPIVAGYVLKSIGSLDLHFLSWHLFPVQVIFMASTLFRLMSFQLFKFVHEPEALTVGQMVRILRSVRGLTMANGFNSLLHPFIEIKAEKYESKT
jgi:MFS family permease